MIIQGASGICESEIGEHDGKILRSYDDISFTARIVCMFLQWKVGWQLRRPNGEGNFP